MINEQIMNKTDLYPQKYVLLSSYLCVAVVKGHQGGVDDFSIQVSRLALPACDWLLRVNPVMELISGPAPQHHLVG